MDLSIFNRVVTTNPQTEAAIGGLVDTSVQFMNALGLLGTPATPVTK